MGFLLAADQSGLRALARLRDWSSGRNLPGGHRPSIVAVLLFEPGRHVEYDEWTRWRFDLIDRESRGELFFFAPTNIAESSRQVGNRNDREENERRAAMTRWLVHGGSDQQDVESAIDGNWSRLVAELYGIPPEALPGVLVFCPDPGQGPDAQGRQVFVPLTSPQTCSALFDALLTQSRRLDRCDTSVDAVLDELPGWDLDPAMSRADWKITIEAGSREGQGTLRRLTARQLDIRTARRLLDSYLPRGPAGGGGLHEEARTSLREWSQHADDETRAILRAVGIQYELFASMGVQDTVDWAGVACGVARVLERTVALSLVHAARAHHGVDLPLFFGKHMPGLGSKEVAEASIDLNLPVSHCWARQGLPGVPWKPPTLMECRTVYEACHIRGHIQDLGLTAGAEAAFREVWRNLAELRNPLAHQVVAHRRDADMALEWLRRLLDLDVVARLGSLRRRLSGVSSQEHSEMRRAWALSRVDIQVRGHGDGGGLVRSGPGSLIHWTFETEGPPELRACLADADGSSVLVGPVSFRVGTLTRQVLERVAYAVLALRNEPAMTEWIAGIHALNAHDGSAALTRRQAFERRVELARARFDALSDAMLSVCHGVVSWGDAAAQWERELVALRPHLVSYCGQDLAVEAAILGLSQNVADVGVIRLREELSLQLSNCLDHPLGHLKAALRRWIREAEAGEVSPGALLEGGGRIIEKARKEGVGSSQEKDQLAHLDNALRRWASALQAKLDRDGLPVIKAAPLEVAVAAKRAAREPDSPLLHAFARTLVEEKAQQNGETRRLQESRREVLREEVQRQVLVLADSLAARLVGIR